MKPSILKYVLKKTLKDKSYIFFRIIYAISFFLILAILVFKDNYFTKFNYDLKNNITYRTLLALPNEINEFNKEQFNKISSIDHVIDSYNSSYESIIVDTSFSRVEYDGKVSIKYRNKEFIPHIIAGRNIEERNDYEVIIPEHFIPNSEDSIHYIKGEDLLNTTFDGTFCEMVRDINTGNVNRGNCHTRKFTIVGVYENENSEYGFNSNNCFISKNNIIELIDIQNEKLYTGVNSVAAQVVIVDKRDNVNNVIEEIENLDMKCTLQGIIDTKLLKYIEICCNLIVALVTTILFFISVSYIKKKVDKDSTSIGIMKSFGFSEKDILINYSLDVLYNIILSTIVSTAIFIIFILIYNTSFSGTIIYFSDKITVSLLSYFVSIIIVLVIPLFLNIYNINKKQSESIITLLDGEYHDY